MNRTILEVVESTLVTKNIDLASAKVHLNSDSTAQATAKEIETEIFDYETLKLHPNFPTTFYICSIDCEPIKFVFFVPFV
jgi:hypothetical protein